MEREVWVDCITLYNNENLYCKNSLWKLLLFLSLKDGCKDEQPVSAWQRFRAVR